jgi:hypothetical protein
MGDFKRKLSKAFNSVVIFVVTSVASIHPSHADVDIKEKATDYFDQSQSDDNDGRAVITSYAVCPGNPKPYPLTDKDFYKEQQRKLDILGFNLGKSGPEKNGVDGDPGYRTKMALRLFRLFYINEECNDLSYEFNPKSENFDDKIIALLDRYSELALMDAEKYGVPSQIAAATRLASIRTAVSFEYLLEKSGAESRFGKDTKAKGSSAEGAFQFIDGTWLAMIKQHGAKYGLANLGNYIKTGKYGAYVPEKHNWVKDDILDLRDSLHLSAIMAAEYALDNANELKKAFPDRDIDYVDNHIAHVLGVGKKGKNWAKSSGAIMFIHYLDTRPDWAPKDFFPSAAKSNIPVFYFTKPYKKKDGKWGTKIIRPRSFKEIYNYFHKKIASGRFFDAEHEKKVAEMVLDINYEFNKDIDLYEGVKHPVEYIKKLCDKNGDGIVEACDDVDENKTSPANTNQDNTDKVSTSHNYKKSLIKLG